MLAVQSMDEIFTIRTVMKPVLVKGEYFVSNRNFSNAVFGFAVNDIKILFGQMNIFFFQIQKLWDAHTIVYQHKDCLAIGIVFVFPQESNLRGGKTASYVFIWIPVFVFRDIYIGRIIFWDNFVFHGIRIELVKKNTDFFQGRIVLAAVINHLL